MRYRFLTSTIGFVLALQSNILLGETTSGCYLNLSIGQVFVIGNENNDIACHNLPYEGDQQLFWKKLNTQLNAADSYLYDEKEQIVVRNSDRETRLYTREKPYCSWKRVSLTVASSGAYVIEECQSGKRAQTISLTNLSTGDTESIVGASMGRYFIDKQNLIKLQVDSTCDSKIECIERCLHFTNQSHCELEIKRYYKGRNNYDGHNFVYRYDPVTKTSIFLAMD